MPKKTEQNFVLPTLDDIFSSQEMRDDAALSKIRNIETKLIDDFEGHPFKVIENDDMIQLAESISKYGVLTPVILRQKEDGRYEMIAGHRRKYASELAGKDTIPAEIRDMTRDEAIIMMVDSNLQRSVILPSEKAFSYKMKLEAMNRQGQRTDLTSTTKLSKLRTNEILGKEMGESREQIRKYIRLTELIPEILDMVDAGKMALKPAVEISYFPKELQEELFDIMDMDECTPSHAQTIRMKKLLGEDKLTPEVIYSIMQEEKPNQKERIILRDERVRQLIPKSIRLNETEDYVIKALEYYKRYRERQERSER